MISRFQGQGGGIAAGFRPGRPGKRAGGIALAVVSAGFAVGLTGCQPVSLAGHTTTPSSGGAVTPTATASGQGSGGTMTTSSGAGSYSFRTLDDPADLTFNQLLGFNSHGMIAGYFGSGASGHPNKGYVLNRTAAGFAIHNENFPGSAQTQVTGLNGKGVTVGFWSHTNNANQVNDNIGFYDIGGFFHSVRFPTNDNSAPPVNQLLGVNFADVAVGFYTDAKGNNHGYTYNILSGRFHSVTIAGATSVTATAINNFGDIAGCFANSTGTMNGFLRTSGGHVYTLAYPGASMTQAFGLNNSREVVGVYTVGTGSSAQMHGFTWTAAHGFTTVDDPQGVGATTVNGVNDQGDLVGFYTDSAGNTDGFAAAPSGQTPIAGLIGGMATPTPSMSASGMPTSSMTSSPSMMPTSSMAPTTQPTMPGKPKPTSSPTSSPSTNPLTPVHW